MKVVVTGGPCTGKSTLIQELASRGFETVPEAARSVIGPLRQTTFFLMPMTRARHSDLQKQVVLRQIELEAKVSAKKGAVFFDRSGFDALAYCKFYDAEIPEELHKYVSGMKFDAVFILEPIGEFENDGLRFETADEAKIVHDILSSVYEKFGHGVIRVPSMPVKQRADFILKSLEVENGK